MIQVKVKCPYCGQSLMTDEKKIDNHPSVKVSIKLKDKTGFLYLSSLYGSYEIISEIDLPMDAIVLFFCPHCNADLRGDRLCDKCNAPMVVFKSFTGGNIQICSRRGCKKHLVEFENLEDELLSFYKSYPLFFSNITKKENE